MPANQLQKLNSTELYSLLFSSYLLTVMVFTAQHYASMGLYNSDTSYGTVSVTSQFYQNGLMDRVCFWLGRQNTCPVLQENLGITNNKGTFLWNLLFAQFNVFQWPNGGSTPKVSACPGKDPDPHQVHGSLCPSEFTTQMTSRSFHPFFCRDTA